MLASFVGIGLGSPVLVLFSLGVFTKPLETEFGWTRAQVSLVATVFTCVNTVTFPFVGALLDRYGPRRVVMFSLPLFTTAYAALYFLPRSLAVYYLMWAAVTVLGAGPSNPAYCKAIAAWFDRRLGLAMGLAVAGQGVGAAAVPAVGYLLITKFGWRLAYVGLAIITLVVTFVVNAAFLRDTPRALNLLPDGAPHAPATEAPTRASADDGYRFREAVRLPAFFVIAGVFFLLGFMSTAILTHQVPMLVDEGMAPGKAAFVQVAFGLALTIGRLSVGFSLDRFLPRTS